MRLSVFSLALLLILASALQAQSWEQTSGPAGANVRTMAVVGPSLVAGLANGEVYVRANATWEKKPNLAGLRTLQSAEGALYSVTESAAMVSYDLGSIWIPYLRLTPSAVVTPVVKSNYQLFVVVNDSLYHSTDDGSTWGFVSVTGTSARFLASYGSILVAAGGTAAISLDNGRSWLPATEDYPAGAQVTAITPFGDEMWIATERNGVYYLKLEEDELDRLRWHDENEGLPILSGSYPLFNTLVPAGEMLFGYGDQGVFRYDDDTDAWVLHAQAPGGTNVQAYGQQVYTWGIDGIAVSANNGVSWQSLTDDFLRNGIQAFASVRKTLVTAASNGIFRTTNEGLTWTRTRSAYARELASSYGVIAAATDRGVELSNDEGVTWTPVSIGGMNKTKSEFSVASNSNGLFVGMRSSPSSGTEQGAVFRSTDQGYTWTECRAGLPEVKGVVAPVDRVVALEDQIFAFTSRGLYVSQDLGLLWSIVKLPGFDWSTDRIRDLRLEHDTLYVATKAMVYVSVDRGSTWSSGRLGLPPGILDHVALYSYLDRLYLKTLTTTGTKFFRFDHGTWSSVDQPLLRGMNFTTLVQHDGFVFAGTESNSVWRRKLTSAGLTHQAHNFQIQTYPNPSRGSAYIRYVLDESASVLIQFIDAGGHVVLTLDEGHRSSGEWSRSLNLTELPAGSYTVQICAGDKVAYKQMVLLN